MKKLIALLLAVVMLAPFVVAQVPENPAFTKKEASQPPTPTPAPAQNNVHEMTAADVESFLDGIVPLQLKQSDIAGATISVVKDG